MNRVGVYVTRLRVGKIATRRNREEVDKCTRGGGEGWPDCTNKSGNVIFVREESLERRDANIEGRHACPPLES